MDQIIKDYFWEYKFDEEKIRNLSKSTDFAEKKFLFGKILVNSTEVLSALGIFKFNDLKKNSLKILKSQSLTMILFLKEKIWRKYFS